MTSTASGKVYGVQRVCRTWKLSRATYYNRTSEAKPGKKDSSSRFHCDSFLVKRIRHHIQVSPFHDEGYRKIWARLRYERVRTSKERVRRLMKAHHLQSVKRPRRERGNKAHDGRITTERPDQMWGMDATSTVTTREGTAHIFIAVDHHSQECLGIHASKSGQTIQALEPLRQAMRHSFDDYNDSLGIGVTIRHDHGSQYISKLFQSELRFLGIESSPSYVREPQCHGVAERFIKTLKEQLLHVTYFDTIEDLRWALLGFKDEYNRNWLCQKHHYKTPSQVREDYFQAQRVA